MLALKAGNGPRVTVLLNQLMVHTGYNCQRPAQNIADKQIFAWDYGKLSHNAEVLKLESKTLRSGLAVAQSVIASLSTSSCCLVNGELRSEGTCLL